MLSNGWGWFVIVLVVGNIIGMVWLLLATSKSNGTDDSATTGHQWDGIEELNNPLPRWWLWLFVITIVYSVIYLYLYPGMGNYEGSLGWTQQSQYQQSLAENRSKQDQFFAEFSELDIPALAKNAKAMNTGERLFLNNCATCHGSDARGAKGYPNLTDNDWLYGDSPEVIQTTIRNGRAGIMPDMGLDAGKASILAYYLKGLAGEQITDYVRDEGKALFAVCAACHVLEGKGNQALGAPNLTDDIWLHGSRIADIETIIEQGIQSKMPSFEALLSENEIKLLSAYVTSLNMDSSQ